MQKLRSLFKIDREKGRYLVSMITLLLVMGIVFHFFNIYFETNDDSTMMDILAGYKTGEPTAGTFFSTIVWDYLICGLYKMYDKVPWYTIAFLIIIYTANVMILKTLLKVCNCSKKAAIGVLIGYLAFFAVFINYSVVFLQFTTVSAIVGSAAIALLLGLYEGEGRAARSLDIFFSVVLFVISFMIRRTAGYVIFAYGIAAFFIKSVKIQKQAKKAGICLSVLLVAGVLAAGVNYLHEQYYSQNGWKEYSSYTTQRSEYMDYAHLSYEEGEEIYTECGWSEALYNVVEGWFFMDPRVNQETFAEINAYTKTKMEKSKENLTEQIANISSGLWNTGNRIKIEVIYLAIAGFMILCMALAGKDWRAFLQLIMGYGACVILYIYLCREGRLPNRVFQLCVIPCSILLNYILCKLSAEKGRTGRWSKIGILVIIPAVCLAGITTKEIYYEAHDGVREQEIRIKQETEKYYKANPDSLYIFDSTISAPGEPFKVCEAKAANFVFWGGTSMYTPVYYKQLEANGRSSLYSEVFYEQNVYFVTGDTKNAELMKTYLESTFENSTEYSIIDNVEQYYIIKFSQIP